jgi:hypothetical protein
MMAILRLPEPPLPSWSVYVLVGVVFLVSYLLRPKPRGEK